MLKLLKYMKPFTGIILTIVIFMLGQAIAELYLPTLMSDIVNNGMVSGDTGYITRNGIYMLLVAFASSICSMVGSFLSSKAAVGFGRDIREKIFTKIEGFSLHEFDKVGTASLITRTTNDITQIQLMLVMSFRFIIYSPILCIGGIIMALSKDKQLTTILGVSVPTLLILMVCVAIAIVPLFQILQKRLDKVNLVAREGLTGIRVIRAFNRILFERNRFKKSNEELMDVSIKANRIMAIIQPIMLLTLNLTSLAIIWFGGFRIAQNNLKLGDMMAFTQYAMQIMFSLIMVSIMFVMMPRAEASAVRVSEVMDMEAEIIDPKEAKTEENIRGHVEFKNVFFRYPEGQAPVLMDISFVTKPGETTAIIGGTGSGKSSLISLIPRFYDIESGQILIDGVDVRDMTQEHLRAKIGFIPQSVVLFSGTVTENIKYGKDDATDEEVLHAAEVAQASTFIQNMADGFDSYIAQGGTNISGGQKQRLSIARALVRKPEIYIFDDSFSALDFKTDASLRSALKKETQDSAVIIVAQRVSTIMNADRIIVLDEGKIAGMGTHRELLRTCEIYKEIVSSQLSEEEIA